MNTKLKIGILSGILLLLMLIAAGTFMQISKPADTLEHQIAQLAGYEQTMLYARGSVYRYGVAGVHVPSSVVSAVSAYESTLAGMEDVAGQYTKKDAALRNSLSGYVASARAIHAEFNTLVNDYNQLGAAKPKPFDEKKVEKVEKLIASHISDFNALSAALGNAAVRHRRQAVMLSGILISVTWLLGLFITWTLVQTVYTILLAGRNEQAVPKIPLSAQNSQRAQCNRCNQLNRYRQLTRCNPYSRCAQCNQRKRYRQVTRRNRCSQRNRPVSRSVHTKPEHLQNRQRQHRGERKTPPIEKAGLP